MAGQPIEQVAVAPSAPAPAPAPSPEPSASPPQNAAVAAAQADQPAAASTAAPAEPNPAGAASTDHTLPPSILEQFDADKAAREKPADAAKPADAKPADKPADKPAEAKPADAKPGDGAKPPEAVAQPAELPKVDYFTEDLKIPETIKITDAQRGEIAGALDLIRGGKTTEGMTALVGLHEKAMQDYAKQTADDQWAAFRKTNEDWRTELMADPVLGGAGHNTAIKAIARMRDRFISSAKPGTPEYQRDAKSFENFLRVTGAGNHPAFMRLLHNVAHDFDEPAMPPADIKPATGNGRRPGGRLGERLYPTMVQKGT